MNAIAKQLGVSTPSILNWIRAHAATHAPRPQPEPGESVVVMELDELWHFLQKKNKLWIWLAFDRSGQRLIDWECGNRDAATLNRLLERLKPWSVTLYCTDDYAPYDTLLPVGRHYIGKDETVAIERVNSRLRHWFARFRSPLRNQSRADLLPADRVLEGARHGNGTVERSWESGVVGQPLGGGAGAAPLFLRPLQ
jgi:IS1 family transposase